MTSRQFITITKKAYDKINIILKENEKNSLLFYVKSGGCNGFNYKLEPVSEQPHKLDEVVKYKDFHIVVCHKSILHILGTTIDWTEDIMGQGFKFDNPMATSMCGCGTSFSSK